MANIQKVVNNEEKAKVVAVGLVDEEYEEDKILQLMIENKVLECEKQKAETEICTCKEKVKELESRVLELESNIKAMNEKVISDRINMVSRRTKQESCSKVRKRLPFEEYECLNKNFMPSTPGVARSPFHGIIDISDEDVCYNEIPKVDNFSDPRKRDALAKSHCSSSENLKKTNLEHIDEEHTEDFKVQSLRTRSAKRKWAANIVTSDGETSVRSVTSCGESEDVLNEYKAILDKIGLKRVSNQKWDLQGDMLADFDKDPELCMRAVCALYRQQTNDEKASKVTIHHNKRGFSQPDAFKASKLAEFLTDGDSSGDLNKTVEELKQYDSKGIELCTKLATKYYKQLFKIYQNKEDPYFLPE